jgi:hypothetical protein
MTWWLLLLGSILSAADRDGVHDTKLARGWVTAHLVYDGMPAPLLKLLVKGMWPGLPFSTAYWNMITYPDYGLTVLTNPFSWEGKGAHFAARGEKFRVSTSRSGTRIKVQISE